MAGSRRTDKKRERYNLSLDPALYRKVKLAAAHQDVAISELVEKALRAFLEREPKLGYGETDGNENSV